MSLTKHLPSAEPGQRRSSALTLVCRGSQGTGDILKSYIDVRRGRRQISWTSGAQLTEIDVWQHGRMYGAWAYLSCLHLRVWVRVRMLWIL